MCALCGAVKPVGENSRLHSLLAVPFPPRAEALTGGIDIYIVDTSRNGIMKVQFLKWGNSLALRVPKVFAQEIGASVGKPATMEVRDGKLVVELAKPRRRPRRYTLEQLVSGITPENRHSELEWGPPIGNEAW
jgi:antitoxin MazE